MEQVATVVKSFSDRLTKHQAEVIFRNGNVCHDDSEWFRS